MHEVEKNAGHPAQNRRAPADNPFLGEPGNGKTQPDHGRKEGMVQAKNDGPEENVDAPGLKAPGGKFAHKIENILYHGEAHADHGAVDDAVQPAVNVMPPEPVDQQQGDAFERLLDHGRNEHGAGQIPHQFTAQEEERDAEQGVEDKGGDNAGDGAPQEGRR